MIYSMQQSLEPQFFYIINMSAGTIIGFRIGKDGIPKLLRPSPLLSFNKPVVSTIEQKSRTIYVTDGGIYADSSEWNKAKTISCYRISEDGSLKLFQTVQSRYFPLFLLIHPSSKFLYVYTGFNGEFINEAPPHQKNQEMLCYRIDEGGSLVEIPSTTIGGPYPLWRLGYPRDIAPHLLFSPSGERLFKLDCWLSDSGQSCRLFAYKVLPNGQFKERDSTGKIEDMYLNVRTPFFPEHERFVALRVRFYRKGDIHQSEDRLTIWQYRDGYFGREITPAQIKLDNLTKLQDSAWEITGLSWNGRFLFTQAEDFDRPAGYIFQLTQDAKQAKLVFKQEDTSFLSSPSRQFIFGERVVYRYENGGRKMEKKFISVFRADEETGRITPVAEYPIPTEMLSDYFINTLFN
jgi:hypothetical protein